jgi:hypothetical protein
MSEWNTEGSDPAQVPAPGPDATQSLWQQRTPRMLAVFGGIAALVLLIGVIVWVSSGDEQVATSSTVPASAPVPTTIGAEATTTPPTTVAETTVPETTVPETTVPETTVPETTVPETTVPETTVPAGPSGDTWRITSPLFPDDPFTLRRVAEVERLAAYDGMIRVTPTGIRCVAIVVDGDDAWHEWCGEPDRAVNFLTLDGIDPWIVEVGSAIGDIALTRQQPTWTLPMNGCTEPITTLISAALASPAVTTGVVCVPGEAFLSNSAVLLQPGPADGGGALVAGGDEGWDVLDYGTSIGCDVDFGGVDRCVLYGVVFDLFEAVLPIPPIEALTTATDIVEMSEQTVAVRSWVGSEADPATIETIIFDELNDPEAEVPATTRRAVGVGDMANLDLLLIEVPALDDSILSTTWAVWIDTDPPATVAKAFAWQTCARGMAGPGICI